jgi:hypothetical protein
VYIGRKPGTREREFEHGEIAEALVEAVDKAATSVFGGEWSKPLALITGLNQRTCNRDRIRQWGLPPWVLLLLAKASAHPYARPLGDIMQGTARLHDMEHARLPPEAKKMFPTLQKDMFEGYANFTLQHSLTFVAWARDEREKARVERAQRPFGDP